MTAALAALLLAAPLRAQAPAAAVERAMARVEAVLAGQPGKDAREVAALDKRASAAFEEIAPLGWRAAPALAAAVRDPRRPAKARLFAVTFLARLRDPAAFEPLAQALHDAGQDPDVRAAAAQALAAQDVPAPAVRPVLCAAAPRADLPRAALDQVLTTLSRLGCDEPAGLEDVARRFGPRPAGPDLATVRRALAALGRTRGKPAAQTLLVLSRWFPARHDARAAVFSALAARPLTLAADGLEMNGHLVLRDALREEASRPEVMLVLVRLADALGPDAAALLLPLIRHPDPEVIASAAEALSRRRSSAALPKLDAVLAKALEDPRFGPKPGRPDPAVSLARIEAAAAALRGAPASSSR